MSAMPEYLPYTEKNSIQEAQINLLFLGRFERQSIESARGIAQAELSEFFPRLAEVRGGSLHIDMSSPGTPIPIGTMSSDLVGFELSNVRGNARPDRVLRLAENTLSVSFMDYESWLDARNVLHEYFVPILSSLPLTQNPVIAFGLRFIDRYTYNGKPDEAKAELLFVRENPHITPYVFRAGSVWHCNTGWFDLTLEDRVLHNFNVASNLIDLASTVTIEHQATMHLAIPRQSITALFEHPDRACRFLEVLDVLHDQNKDILRRVLLPEMLVRIGLEP